MGKRRKKPPHKGRDSAPAKSAAPAAAAARAAVPTAAVRPRLGDPWLIAILALSLALQLLVWWQHRTSPYQEIPIADAAQYDLWARELAAGDWLGREAFHQAPLYPYLLGAIYALAGPRAAAAQAFQILLNLGSIALLYRCGRRLIGRRPALAAAAALALHPAFVFYAMKLLSAALIVFLNLWVLWLWLRAAERRTTGAWIATGLASGLLVLAQPSALLLLGLGVFGIGAALAAPGRARARWALSYGAAAALVIAPISLRNFLLDGDWVLVSSSGGETFYMGNNPRAEGAITIIPGVSGFVGEQQSDVRRLAEQAAGRELHRAEVSAFWYQRAFEYVRAEPLDYLVLELKKLYLMLVASDLPDMVDLRFERERFLPALWLLPMPFAPVLAAAGLGFGPALRSWRRWFPVLALGLVHLATVLLFFMATRLRLPLVPLLLLIGAGGVSELWAGRRGRGARSSRALTMLAAGAALALLLALLDATVQRDPAFFHNQLGGIYAQLERWELARQQFQRAAQLDATLADAEVNLGQIAMTRRQLDAAEAHYRKAAAIDPDSAAAWRGLAQLQLERGDPAAALEVLEQPVVARSADYPVLLAQVQRQRGDLEQAVRILKRALGGGRGSPALYQELAAVELERGDWEAAQQALAAAERLGGGADPRTLLQRGRLLLEQGDAPGAERVLRRAEPLRRGDPVLLGLLGLAAFRQGRSERAIELYRRSLERDPGAAEVRANLGNALLAAGRPAQAVEQLEAAARGRSESAELRYNLGNAYLALGRAVPAAAQLRRALELRPDYLEAYGNLGALLTRTGQTAPALAVLREGLRRFPDSAPLHLNLAVALLQAGDRSAARRHLERARAGGLAIPPALNQM